MQRFISITRLAYFIIIIGCTLMPSLLHAQPGFGDDTDDVPIDGGLTLLIAAGAGYAVKKIKLATGKEKTTTQESV